MPPRSDVTVTGPYETDAAQRLRDFLTRGDQPFAWTEAPAPVRVSFGGRELVEPSLEELADALGIRYPPSASEYDLIVVGAGPAGLAAAVYAASDGLRTVVAERDVPGGQASHTSQIENYFGIDPLGEPMSGARLARIGGRQAETFGAELLIMRGVVGRGSRHEGLHSVRLATGEELTAPALVCATGVEWRRLDTPGLDELLGRGVYYGAGRSEAPLMRGKHVVVVGGGNSAGQAALNFAQYAESVSMLCRGASLSATLSAYLGHRIDDDPRIDVRVRSQLAGVEGDGRLTAVTVAGESGTERLPADYLFLTIGGVPRTEWAADGGPARDDAGFLLTGHEIPRDAWSEDREPMPLESSTPGFFVAGDVRHGSTKRVAAAVGEGAMAVALVHRYLDERQT